MKEKNKDKNRKNISNYTLDLPKEMDAILNGIGSYVKWIASVSIFLITVSLTVLAMKENISIFKQDYSFYHPYYIIH